MSKIFNENKLRPYYMFVAYFEQFDAIEPVFIKLIYNDFKAAPEFSSIYNGPGKYEINIDNNVAMGINQYSKATVVAKIGYAGAVENKLESYLDTSHYKIDLTNYYLPFTSRENINGNFYLIYTKLKQ